MKVKLSAIIDGFEFDSIETSSFLNLKTGEIVFFQDEEIRAAEDNEDLIGKHDWYIEAVEKAKQYLENQDEYIALPTKYEFHEYRIVQDFISSLPIEEQRNELYSLIKSKGAFSRFRRGLERFLLEDKWYKYKDEAILKFVKNWCEENNIELEDEH